MQYIYDQEEGGKVYAGNQYQCTFMNLTSNERFNERISRLRVQTERVAEALQLGRLLQERVLQAVASRVEVLLDRVQGHVQNCALVRRQVLLHLKATQEGQTIQLLAISPKTHSSIHSAYLLGYVHDAAERILHILFTRHVILEESRHVFDFGICGQILGIVREIFEHHLQNGFNERPIEQNRCT